MTTPQNRRKTGKPRDTNGRFQKGTSGNPGGRPKLPESIVELAREHTESAMQTLIRIATDPEAPPSSQVAAAQAILDRGWGRPTQPVQPVEIETTEHNRYEVSTEWLKAQILKAHPEAAAERKR